MKKSLPLVILGLVLVLSPAQRSAAAVSSDWPSLGYSAALTNDNTTEKTLTVHNVLKLKVRWTAPIADQSYPVVAGNRVYVPFLTKTTVHVRALDLATGKPVATYFKDALGGMLVTGTTLYVAGRMLQAIDLTGAAPAVQVTATPTARGSTFVYPVADKKYIVAGYASGSTTVATSLYTIDSSTNTVVRKLPSTSALGTVGANRILTDTSGGSTFYDEATGRKLASQTLLGSHWFVGPHLAYTVASVHRSNAAIYAYDGLGRKVWSRTVGPLLATQGSDWPHAVSDTGLYIQSLRPSERVQALDPDTGAVLWSRNVSFIQRLALANGVLYVLSYGLGQPVRVVTLDATTGKFLGAIVLSAGYYAFGAPNALMVADGMVFIRAVGPAGSTLIALGLPTAGH